jgi:putative restriction endonuclease
MTYSDILEQLYNLRRDKRGDYERPHKPVLLLTLFDLFEAGLAEDNRFAVNDDLFATWRMYFDIVKLHNDQPTVENPVYYLSGDNIWSLISYEGHLDVYREISFKAAPSKKWLTEKIQFGKLQDDFFAILSTSGKVFQLRNAIISRYFPTHRKELLDLSSRNIMHLSHSHKKLQISEMDEEASKARSGAFRKLVLGLYDNRCVACGLRIVIGELKFVDAAHIVPWSESYNDHPTNGIALCKNHHWAMDQNVIAPGMDRRWHVSPVLDERNADHQNLINLNGKTLFEPNEKRFRPTEELLEWRYERLLRSTSI